MDEPTPLAAGAELSALAITLLKGVIYREGDERLWGALLGLQARVRDTVAVLGLELVLDEAEGYAFLKSRPEPDAEEAAPRLPRLVARRPLSFPVRAIASSTANISGCRCACVVLAFGRLEEQFCQVVLVASGFQAFVLETKLGVVIPVSRNADSTPASPRASASMKASSTSAASVSWLPLRART